MNKLMTPKVIIFLIFSIVAMFIYSLSASFLDNKVDDLFVKIFTTIQNKKASENVVLVVIDDKSLDEISWPWRRDLFAEIFDFLENKTEASVVVFQNLVVFPDTYNPDADNIFFDKIKHQNKLIYSYILLNSSMAGDVLPVEYYDVFESKSNVNIVDKRKNNKVSTYKGVINLPKEFLLNAKFLASSIIPEDNDEIVRHYMPVVKFRDKLLPSIALSAYSMRTGIKSFVLYDDYLCSDDGCSSLKIPIRHKKGQDYIGNNVLGILSFYDWYKPISNNYSHVTYSAIDILQSNSAIQKGEEPIISPSLFKDKIVIVGLNADKNVWEQLSETPVLNKQADIDLHATMIDNMISNTFRTVNTNDYTLFITLLFSFFIIRGFKNFRHNIIFTSIFVLIYFAYYIYEYILGIYIPPITPVVTMYSIAILKNVFSIITTDKTSEMIKHAMGKYLSKDVMKQVISDLDKLKLGGVRAMVTILFVDIRNFTQISEDLSPQEVSSVLNEYFSTIEPLVGKYHGIVNKYMGDGLLAIFGEPVKNPNHALDAIKCASEILDSVKFLREKFYNEGKPVINVGIGINSGDVFAGNIGTEERLEYTVIGDNVNLAYRIESYNHVLKTQFLISEYTYEFVKDNVEVVKLSQVNIKGKSKPIDIYEVLRIKNNDK